MHPTTPRRRLTAALALGLAAAALLGGCGDDDDTTAVSGDATQPTDAAEPSETTETTEVAGEIEVSGAWARTSPAIATAGAAYLDITNGTDADDVLLEASVDPSVAARVELHETTIATEDPDADMGGGDAGQGMTSTSMAGAPMMEMQPVEEIPVPAGETVVLEPGGLHIMVLDLVEPLVVGDTFELTLTFEEAGDIVVTAEVRDTAP